MEEVVGKQTLSWMRPLQSAGEYVSNNPDSEIQKRFDVDVMNFLSNCNLPFSFVETRVIKHFLSILSPKYTLNNRHTMSYRMSPLLYHNLNTVIVESLVWSYHTAFGLHL